MLELAIQVASDGFHIDPAWVIGALISALGAMSTVVLAMWRYFVAEGKRKDELIDRLLRQTARTAEVTDRVVSTAETRERGTRRS